jgi:hypothetical protein
MSQIDMTEVLPKPVGKSSVDGMSPFTSRSNNRRCQLRARDEITESKEKNPAAGRNAGKESGVYA